MMDIMQSVRTVLTNYAKFEGRSGRAEFWWWVLAYFLAYCVAFVVGGAIGSGKLLAWLLALVVFVPSLAVTVRRFHDIGKSAIWAVLMIIPIVNIIVALIFLTQSSSSPNEYGEGPQGPAA